MSPADLAGLDTEAMLGGLRRWVECESPTIDPRAVDRMMDLAASDLSLAGAAVERLTSGDAGAAGAVLARFPHRDIGKPGILVMGHLDTVHPLGTLEVLPFRREGNLCYGPGIKDMKAGNFLSLWAIRQLVARGIETPLPVSVLFTGDEETGSPHTRPLIEALARRNRYVLVPEPGEDAGGVTIGRHEVARFTLAARGTPTHAGATPEKGRSAIRQMAEKIVAVEALGSPGVSFSVGIVQGGLWSNCVTTHCSAELLVLIRDPAQKEERLAALMALQSDEPGMSFTVTPLRERPRWEGNEASHALHAAAREIGAALGLDLKGHVSGGGSDGNFTGALQIPTLDGLGALGRDHHTLNEHIFVDSLAPRTLLMANLIATLN
ncbi:M20/M25/M40 family metallo-hydrolase [Aureimonas populi]|uniref:M20/M25/M40 family metallo-hydrolase n=1 Tax=Aureimonas populi TaxID=1701758 RepID=A0ABW5CRU3_9HYPH|nr:M20/M25/M40 family metallo-hydrolase [Aureimonas populi]